MLSNLFTVFPENETPAPIIFIVYLLLFHSFVGPDCENLWTYCKTTKTHQSISGKSYFFLNYRGLFSEAFFPKITIMEKPLSKHKKMEAFLLRTYSLT